MREHLDVVSTWSRDDKPIAIARVIKTWGSAPQPVGSFMFIRADGKMAGSVSGGCVEGAVVKEALAGLPSKSTKLLEYGTSNEQAWNVGLACGGTIQVLIQWVSFKTDPVWENLFGHVSNNRSCVLVSALSGETTCLINQSGEIIGEDLNEEIKQEAHTALEERTHKVIESQGVKYFIQIFHRKPTLLIIGAAHVSSDLVKLGKEFGFETIVADPRGYFTENATFQEKPDQLLTAYPSEVLNDFPLDTYTFAVILSHDPKIDDDALAILLKSDVAYIGAMGSRKITQERRNRFLERGYSEEDLDRIHAPIGVNIKAKTAKEIALSIMGELVMVKNEFN